MKPEDSEKAFAAAGSDVLKLGAGVERPVTLHGGRFLFDTANENLLTGLLPPLIHIKTDATSAGRIQFMLQMNASEAANPRPGSEFVIARLMELVLVDILRDQSLRKECRQAGMLGGLSDTVVAVAIQAMHQDVAHSWTVAELARLAGVSRSKFAARFQKMVGVGPIQYLHNWRMAIAKDELWLGTQSLSEIAFAIGFQSVSAFSTAFSRTVGTPPKRYAASAK
jgi:AraC-like DNA-binding protein